MQHLLFLLILATAMGQDFVNLIDELLKDGGKWILAAAGTTGVPLLSEACIHITITDTGIESECILANHNITPHRVKNIQLYGINENNKVEILSRGPIHQYMVKGNANNNFHEELSNEVDFDTAINSPLCYNPKNRAVDNFRYIITPIDKTTNHILLIGVKRRFPIPEYQVTILTKTKIMPDELHEMTRNVNHRNYLNLKDVCMLEDMNPTVNPAVVTLSPYCLPNMHTRCAEGVHWQNKSEDGIFVFSPNHKELETIMVKHST